MKLISVVTACYNEEDNIREIYTRIKEVFKNLPEYNYEHLFIDNASTDKTGDVLKEIARDDKNVKIIINTRNFGHIRSPCYALLQTKGDAVILIVADMQDPPEMIPVFLKKWEEGIKVVIGVKAKSHGNLLLNFIRRSYYKFITTIAETPLIKDFTGFGLYDKKVIDIMKQIDDPYPYFRGLISEIGFEVVKIPYEQPTRSKGKTKNNFYTLFDMAMLGITGYSKIPIRLMTILGFVLSFVSFLLSIIFLLLKLFFWQNFTLGLAPILIGLFFFSSVQLLFIGFLGEYISSIHTQVLKRPMVIEKERLNF